MFDAGTRESGMSKAGLDNRHHNQDGARFCRRLSPNRQVERRFSSPERDIAEPASPRLQDRSSGSQDHARLGLKAFPSELSAGARDACPACAGVCA
jgi:hypothetical protein